MCLLTRNTCCAVLSTALGESYREMEKRKSKNIVVQRVIDTICVHILCRETRLGFMDRASTMVRHITACFANPYGIY